MIKHVSFDFWGTLATANPEFARARTEYLAGFFGMDYTSMKNAYTAVKTRLDDNAETKGTQGGVIEAYFELFAEVGFKGLREHAEALNQEVSDLFLKHPPTFPEGWDEALSNLVKSGKSISITSNTNFVCGDVLRELIQYIPFSFELFSDLLGLAKPNPAMFALVRDMSGKDFGHILHIGDNLNADVRGAEAVGMHAVLVDSPESTVAYLSLNVI